MKALVKSSLILVVAVVLLIPIYMYFSFDVSNLKQHNPKKRVTDPWVKLQDISHFAKWAIVISEDWAFYQHEGIDVEQMKVAVSEILAAERYRGASTITQQLVKNILLTDSRTLWRKVHEIILAKKIERILSKDRILEIYLNYIEFGPDLYGIQLASQHYFGKNAGQLSAREGAFLAMLLPSPKRYYESFRKKKLTAFAQDRIRVTLEKLRIAKILTQENYAKEIADKFAWESPDHD